MFVVFVAIETLIFQVVLVNVAAVFLLVVCGSFFFLVFLLLVAAVACRNSKCIFKSEI